MKFKDLNTLKEDELAKKEKEAKFELIKLQGQVATGTPPKSPSQIRELKKVLARIETLRTARNSQQSEIVDTTNKKN